MFNFLLTSRYKVNYDQYLSITQVNDVSSKPIGGFNIHSQKKNFCHFDRIRISCAASTSCSFFHLFPAWPQNIENSIQSIEQKIHNLVQKINMGLLGIV